MIMNPNEKVWWKGPEVTINWAPANEIKEKEKNNTVFMLNYTLWKIDDEEIKKEIRWASKDGMSWKELTFWEIKNILEPKWYIALISKDWFLNIEKSNITPQKEAIIEKTKKELKVAEETNTTTDDWRKYYANNPVVVWWESINIVDNREKYWLMKWIKPNEEWAEYADYESVNLGEVFFSDAKKDELEWTLKELNEIIVSNPKWRINGELVKDTDYYKEIVAVNDLIKTQKFSVAENNIPENLQKVA